VHAGLERSVHGLGDGEELDAVAQLHRVLHVLLGDGGDALGVDVLEIDRGAEGEGGEDLELVGRIHPFDVEGGIGLGVALGLRFLEHDGEVETLPRHLGQDVVAGPVDDAEGREHAVGGQPVLHRADEGNAPGHCRLEAEHDAVAPGRREDLGTVMGEERLVGGDHVLACLERLEDEGPCRLEPTYQLDDDLHRRIVEYLGRVAHEGEAGDVEAVSRARGVGIRDAVQAQPAARALLHLRAVGLEDLDHAASDRTEAEKADPDLVHGGDRRRRRRAVSGRRVS
jgi:hypothetical protein